MRGVSMFDVYRWPKSALIGRLLSSAATVDPIRRLSRVARASAVMLGLLGTAVQAAEPPLARPTPQAALETLLGSTVGRPEAGAATSGAGRVTPAPAALDGQAGARTTVTVARGQALDTLLRQHLTDSPLRVEVLRELVRQLNPQAFAPGSGYRLTAGARLQLPTREDQMRHSFGSTALASKGAAEADSAGNGAAAAARKGWVRYP